MFSPIIVRNPKPFPYQQQPQRQPYPQHRSQFLRLSASTPNLPPMQLAPHPQFNVYTPSPASTPSVPNNYQCRYDNDSAIHVPDPVPIKGPSSVSKIGTHDQVPRGRRRLGNDYNGSMNFISREQVRMDLPRTEHMFPQSSLPPPTPQHKPQPPLPSLCRLRI